MVGLRPLEASILVRIQVRQLAELKIRLHQIRVTLKELDEFLATKPHIYRSLRGHCLGAHPSRASSFIFIRHCISKSFEYRQPHQLDRV